MTKKDSRQPTEAELSAEMGRSIRFERRVWVALDRDAVACGRTSVKQLEQLLRLYYGISAAEVDQRKLAGIDLKPNRVSREPDEVEALKGALRQDRKGKPDKANTNKTGTNVTR